MLAFTVVVTGLALVDGLVLLAVAPQLRALRNIANDHARAVEVTTRLRARLTSARRDLVGELRRDDEDAPRRAALAAAAFDRVDAEMGALLPLADTAQEQSDVAGIRAALARCAEEADRIRVLLHRGDLPGARLRVEPLVDATTSANEAADAFVSFNALQVEDLSHDASRSLRWTVLGATLLALAGGAAAVALLRRALRGLAADEAFAAARSAELEAFAARAAHELRTPLQTVSLALTALDAGGSPRALDVARRSVERLRATVDGLLDFARAGGVTADRSEADLSRVLADVQGELATHIASAQVSVDVAVPEGTSVGIGTIHLATILRNVVGNAVKHAGGRPGARISVRASAAAPSTVHLEVEDNGPGIPPEALPRVFEPFVRATSRTEGHGLGLATVKRLVEAHRGAVHISSALGRGTVVELDLPGSAARPAAPPEWSARSPA